MTRARGSGVKRATDVTVAGLLLLLAAPVCLVAAVIVLLQDGRPVLFSQQRLGAEGRLFRVWKFRTMRNHDDEPLALGQVGHDHPLLTSSGRWLRRTKVDELPQLLGVVTGAMSLVGPRPTLPEYLAGFSDYEKRRLLVRPGLTGWAQVNGNTRLTWPERILLDVWYVDHWSVWLDMKILLLTIDAVVRGERRNERRLQRAVSHAERSRRSS